MDKDNGGKGVGKNQEIGKPSYVLEAEIRKEINDMLLEGIYWRLMDERTSGDKGNLDLELSRKGLLL